MEDTPNDAELIERVLRKSGLAFERQLVDNRDDYIRALAEHLPDIVLSDHLLPGFSSPEALDILKRLNYKTPFILITSTISEEFAVDIIKQGADDYILKDRLQRLPSAINNALEKYKLEKERQKFIEGVIENEALLKEAEQMAHFGSFSVDNVNNVVKWSDECYRIFGYGRGETVPSFDKFLMAVHPDDREFLKQTIYNSPSNQNTLKVNYRIGTGNDVKHIYSELALERNALGKPIYIKGFVHDITNVKLAEESLHKSETNLRTIFNNTDTGYVLFNPSQQVISFNSHAYVLSKALYGKELKEGSHAAAYFPEKRMQAINNFFANAIKGENTAYETSLLDSDGAAKWYHTRWLGIAGEQKSNFGVIMAVSDITERKTAELEREKIANDLIKRNNALEQFAFIVSHNLRAPVANIIGLADALTDKDGVEENIKEHFLKGLSVSAKKLDEVVYDLNQILRISQRINEQKEIVYYQQLVEDIKLALSARIASEGVIIKTDFTRMMNIYTLKSYLYNIFYNLILNSINFRQPVRSPLIEIKSRQEEMAAVLTFSDNGRGIDLEKYGKQIFGLYKRFDTSADGRGMGLCMAKTQTETLGGKISVESEVNKGTTFIIELPV